MDVSVIFQNSLPADHEKNFLVKFRDEESIMSLLLNRKKDYFITNAIIYINKNDDDADDDDNDDDDDDDDHDDHDNEKKIKDLEENAKKYKVMEENKKFETIVSKTFTLSCDNTGYRNNFNPSYKLKFEEKQMEKYLKLYKYYDTKNRKIDYFKVYNLLANLRQGLVYNYDNSTRESWSQPPIDKITYTLSENEKKIKAVCEKQLIYRI